MGGGAFINFQFWSFNDGVFFDLRKSAVLNIRPTTKWFNSCYMDFWLQRPAPNLA